MKRIANSWKNAAILMFVITGGMMAVIAGIRGLGYTVGITQSASVHNFMFLLTERETDTLDVGQFVSFPYPETVLRDGNLIKRVTAIAGDEIDSRSEGRIFINGVLFHEAKAVSSKGRELLAIKSQTIPEGYVYVSGDIKDSYDSRYAEFGLIAISDIDKVGRPLW